jgi:hypothetical protein
MKLVVQALLRGGIPFVIMTAIAAWLQFGDNEPDQARGTFWAGLIATAVGAASVIYDLPDWALRKQSLVHFLVMLVTVYPCLLLSEWFVVEGIRDALRIFGLFVLVGIVLWGSFFMISTRLHRPGA